MKKIKVTKTKIKSKPPGSAPTSTHLKKLKGSDSAPGATHDRSANLGRYLHKAKKSKVRAPEPIGVGAIVKSMKKQKRMFTNVD
jgi:hypothetical protein